jgi:transcriptional regulator with XRE-family HTH domain
MKRLTALMKKHGDKLSDLAEFLDVSTNTVWRWRSGENVPVRR